MHYLRGVARATMRMPSAAVFGYGPKTILSRRIYPPADRDTDDADRRGDAEQTTIPDSPARKRLPSATGTRPGPSDLHTNVSTRPDAADRCRIGGARRDQRQHPDEPALGCCALRD